MKRAGLWGGEESARALLTELIEESRLYRKSEEFQGLLTFVTKLRNVAPFNAMLLHIQRPGIQYVASRYDWLHRFGRKPKEGARPLLILYPFGPVAFVYDLADTEGNPLPDIVLNPFPADGRMEEERLAGFLKRLARRDIEVVQVKSGDGLAGRIEAQRFFSPPDPGQAGVKVEIFYKVTLNGNHDANQKFTSLAHELAHLFLGHLGSNDKLQIKNRTSFTKGQVEIEAESTAYLVCMRHGIRPASHKYLSAFIGGSTPEDVPDLYAVMKAAGQVENLLGIGPEVMRFDEQG